MDNIDSAALHMADKTIGGIDPAAELSSQITDQRFRLANTDQDTAALDILEQLIDALGHLFVLSLPVQVIVPRRLGELLLILHGLQFLRDLDDYLAFFDLLEAFPDILLVCLGIKGVG